MRLNISCNFDCTEEELPILCRFAANLLARDLCDFTAYSPRFDAQYLADLESRIEVVKELVRPNSETVEQQVITERMYQMLDNLIFPINYLEGYLKLAGNQVPVSPAEFGLVQLRKRVRQRDVESVLMLLQIVDGNIKKYKNDLMTKGLSAALIARFTVISKLLDEDMDKKFALVSQRYANVQKNRGLLKELYDQLNEICSVGKILYWSTNESKQKDYTLTRMICQVRRIGKEVDEMRSVAV
jgi:hypothetical protein